MTDAEDQQRIQHFIQQVANNPQEILNQIDALQRRVDDASTDTPASSEATPPIAPMLDPQTVQALYALFQSMQTNQPPPVVLPPPPAAPAISKSEKLPDIPEYDGDVDKLDAWEQSLIHKMHANHDRYPTDQKKIAYAENRLTMGKKAQILMGKYRSDGLCILVSFKDYRAKLRKCCGDQFEAENARTYLRDKLRQEKLPFDEYYNLFLQKKERSQMEEASLIDALQRNVNYDTQRAAFSWRTRLNEKPSTFDEWVQAYSDSDNELRQLKHRMPRQTPVTPTPTSKPKTSDSNLLGQRAVPVVPIAAVPAVPIAAGDPMDLSSAMATVKGQKLTNPGVKGICMKWNLCFYCKLQHPGKDAKDCPNKGKSNFRLMNLEATPGPEGGVLLPSGNA